MNIKTRNQKISASLPADSSDVTVTYNGFLSTPDTDSIYVHLGYADSNGLWQDVKSVEMKKNIQNVYEATIPVKNKNSVNFAFYNNDGVWDNNNGNNYSLAITNRPSW